MRTTCEKLDCGKPAVAQVRLGDVVVARACLDYTPELVEFIGRHLGWGSHTVIQNGTG